MSAFREDLVRLGDELEPTETELAAMRSRLRDRPPRRRRVPLFPIAAAVAAVAVVALGVGAAGMVSTPEQVLLADGAGWRDVAAGVRVHALGQGTARATSPGAAIDWTSGTLTVDVEPGSGPVVVDTPDARIRVIGTVYRVDREPWGTRVGVERGRVEVTCAGGRHLQVAVGERVACPRSAAAGLARAHRLVGTEPGGAVLQAIDEAGWAPGNTPDVAAELLALRATTLAGLGRDREAIAACEGYLARGDGSRTAEIASLAARLALPLGCDTARPFLQRLVERDDPIGLVALAACEPPDAARALLVRASALELSDEARAQVTSRLAALGSP